MNIRIIVDVIISLLLVLANCKYLILNNNNNNNNNNNAFLKRDSFFVIHVKEISNKSVPVCSVASFFTAQLVHEISCEI